MHLFFFMIIFFLTVFVFRSLIHWRNTGLNPMTFDRGDDAHAFIGKSFKIIALTEFIVVGIYAFTPGFYQYLIPFSYLERLYLNYLGWGLLFVSLIWIFLAQLQMANSWRIGIDYEHKTELVTKGFFAISRNPIFLGILIADLGLFLVIPNAFSMLIIGLSFFAIQIQIRLEEAFLKESHQEEFQRYFNKVRRWL